jgi:hypothetical protein
METNLKLARFYLDHTDTLNNYKTNITSIYKEVEDSLKGLFTDQIEETINTIYKSIAQYKEPYYNEFKPQLVGKINNVVNEISKILINSLDEDFKDEKKIVDPIIKRNDLSKIDALVSTFGSTRLNFSVNVQNIVFQYGYKIKPVKEDSTVYLDIYAGGYTDATIYYGNDFFNASIAGALGKGYIGMNITNNFSNDRVYFDYFTKYENNSYTQTLHELTKLDSWGVCEDAVECFVTKNNDYCPYIVRSDDKTIVKPDSNDLDYYKNSSFYLFTGYTEDSVCTFANYLYSHEITKYEFNSTIRRIL